MLVAGLVILDFFLRSCVVQVLVASGVRLGSVQVLIVSRVALDF